MLCSNMEGFLMLMLKPLAIQYQRFFEGSLVEFIVHHPKILVVEFSVFDHSIKRVKPQ
jgi:hypothetical protein